MSLRPFTSEELRKVNQGQMYAKLEARSCSAKTGKVYLVRREFVTHDADGNPTGTKRTQVTVRVGGENLSQLLTVLAVDVVSVFEEVAPEGMDPVTIQAARACGYQTIQGLRDAWIVQHPRSPLAKIVWFALGDVRDRSLFLQYSGLGSDYTRSSSRALDDAEALTPEQLAALVGVNRQKDDARRAKAAQAIRDEETLGQRVERLERVRERYGNEVYKGIRQNLRKIEQRTTRGEKKLP